MEKGFFKPVLILFLLFSIFPANAQEDEFLPLDDNFVSFEEFQDSTQNTSSCANCSSCSSGSVSFSTPFKELPFVFVFITLAILLWVKKNRTKTLFWSLGLLLFGSLIFMVAQQESAEQALAENDVEIQSTSKIETTAANDIAATITTDEGFEAFDEFEETDEFESFDEFEEFSASDSITENVSASRKDEGLLSKSDRKKLTRILIALLATCIAGFLFYRPGLHYLRYVFLLLALVYLGFYSGGCP